jgi:hypothetical protein
LGAKKRRRKSDFALILVDTFNSAAVKPPALGAPATVSFAPEI